MFSVSCYPDGCHHSIKHNYQWYVFVYEFIDCYNDKLNAYKNAYAIAGFYRLHIAIF